MRVGIVEVLGAADVNNILESELGKEVSNLEIKRQMVPTIDDAALGAKRLIEDSTCDFVVIGYALEHEEKLSQAFQHTVLTVQFMLKKNIFRVIVPADREFEEYTREAAREIIRYHYKPGDLQKERSAVDAPQDSSFNPFAVFG